MDRLKTPEKSPARKRARRAWDELADQPFLSPGLRRGTEQGSYYSLELLRTPPATRRLAYWLLGILALVIGAMFLPWQQNIRAEGSVTALNPEERPQTLNSKLHGQISAWYVSEGSFIEKGDSIARISEIKDKYFDPNMLQRLQARINAKQQAIQAYGEKISALNEQISALSQGRELSLNKARNKLRQARLKVQSDSIDLVAARTNQRVADQRFERQERLYDTGLKSKTELEQRELKLQGAQAKMVSADNKLQSARQELLSARLNLGSIQADYAEKLAKSRSEKSSALSLQSEAEAALAKLENQLANMTRRVENRVIRAPRDGYLVRALKQGIGETVKAGDPVARIVSNDPNKAVELYIRDTDVPLIHPGDKVRLHFDGWPALQFSGWPSVSVGTFGGVVKVVDYVSDNRDFYRVLVVPDPEDEPWPDHLRLGSGVFGWTMLNEVPLWYEIWRQLNGFRPTLSQEPTKPDGKGGQKNGPANKTGQPKKPSLPIR